jgi:hypothetical protein
MKEVLIETVRKVWIEEGYLLVRPWPEDPSCIEICTEPGTDSEEYFGKVSITFVTPEGLRYFAGALELAALDMEKEGKEMTGLDHHGWKIDAERKPVPVSERPPCGSGRVL